METLSATPLDEIPLQPSKIENKHKKILLLGVLIIIAIASFILFRTINQSKEQTAGNLLLSAKDQKSLTTLIHDYPNSSASISATIKLANHQWESNQPKTAIQTLKTLVEEKTSHPAIPTALFQLGSYYDSQNKLEEAQKTFQEVLEYENAHYLGPLAHIRIGDIKKNSGNIEEARQHYQQAIDNYPELFQRNLLMAQANYPDTASLAKTRLDLLTTASPKIIPILTLPDTTLPSSDFLIPHDSESPLLKKLEK